MLCDSETEYLVTLLMNAGNVNYLKVVQSPIHQSKIKSNYSKASRYTASTYTDFTDTLFLIGSRKILATLILSLFFTDTRLFTSGKIKIIEFSLSKSEFVP